MKTPPFLIGAALLFWGWQTGFLIVGAIMAAALEGTRLLKMRWDFSDEDFTRIWTLCTLLCLAATVFAFTDNQGPSSFGGFFQNPDPATTRTASTASARTAVALVRWLPMLFFLFVAAQAFSSRQGIPLQTISLILRLRWQKARKSGLPMPAGRNVDVAYPYLILCLFAASAHASEGSQSFFWGFCALLAWALWSQRSPRFRFGIWAAVLAAAIGLGYLGQRGLGHLQNYLESFNPQWFSTVGFQSADPARARTGLGHIGRLKLSGKIVIRLEPKAGLPPACLREASYRTYRKQVWYSEATINDFQIVPSEPNSNTYELLPGKTNSSVVNIACYLPGRKALLPLPSGCGQLENLFVFSLQKSSLGAVLAEGPGLVLFDAHYGPGATIDALPASTQAQTNEDLSVPEAETPALDQIIAELQLKKGQSQEQALRTLQGFFQDKFTYSTWEEPSRSSSTNETPLSRFLLRTRSGHCEYFATASVLLLRRLDIPARYAVGYAVHETSGRKYVVRQRDAHAWSLVWDQEKQVWQDFDSTPASWVESEAKRASPLQFFSDLWSRITFEFSKFRWGQTQLRQYLLWSLAPILALLLYQIIFRHRQHRKVPAAAPSFNWPGLDSEFYQLERELANRGLARRPSEPLSDWLQRALSAPALVALRDPLLSLLRLHYRYRFDPHGLTQADREQLSHEAKACLGRLAHDRTIR